jgi:hypothetical protein
LQGEVLKELTAKYELEPNLAGMDVSWLQQGRFR